MDNIKFLQIDSLYFRLPDDFEGNIIDAFVMLGMYIHNNYDIENHEIGFAEEQLDREELSKKIWNKFIDKYPHDEGKCTGSFGITEMKDGEYIAIG